MKKEWKEESAVKYQDLLLKEEFQNRRIRFEGVNLIRPVPLLQQSNQGSWMMPVHILTNKLGRITHPRSLRTNRSSLIDAAYSFLQSKFPDRLYSRSNRNGLRLLTDLMGIGWAVVDKGDGPKFRLIVENGYDGSRGGKPGLGYQIYEAARKGFQGAEHGAEEPYSGCLIKVSKKSVDKKAVYQIERKHGACDIDILLATMPESELKALCPIEEVLRDVEREDEMEFLQKTLPPDLFSEFERSLEG